jgi:hypothetical protein
MVGPAGDGQLLLTYTQAVNELSRSRRIFSRLIGAPLEADVSDRVTPLPELEGETTEPDDSDDVKVDDAMDDSVDDQTDDTPTESSDPEQPAPDDSTQEPVSDDSSNVEQGTTSNGEDSETKAQPDADGDPAADAGAEAEQTDMTPRANPTETVGDAGLDSAGRERTSSGGCSLDPKRANSAQALWLLAALALVRRRRQR